MQRVTVPSQNETEWTENGLVCGWGSTSEGGPISDVLQKVTVPLVDDNSERKRMINKLLFMDSYDFSVPRDVRRGEDQRQHDLRRRNGRGHLRGKSGSIQPPIVHRDV